MGFADRLLTDVFMAGTLYIIATPIGNLEDISSRALKVLGSVDLLLSEDTRVTRRLLSRYGISVVTESYREQVHSRKIGRIADLLRGGKDVGLVSDAGTPSISDPGGRLVHEVLMMEPSVQVVPIPGPSAVTVALSVSGFPADRFVFLGFPPHKKGRAGFFEEALGFPMTTVLYESPHRIMKALDAIEKLDAERDLCVARELTKIHETIYRGTAAEVREMIKNTSLKGEFVIVISRKK